MKHTEATIQKAVAAHLKRHGTRDVVWWHTMNGAYLAGKDGRGRAIQWARMFSFGALPGVSDILAFAPWGKMYCLELKAPGGRATEAQLKFQSDMARNGAFCCVAEGINEALNTLKMWGLLQGKVQ